MILFGSQMIAALGMTQCSYCICEISPQGLTKEREDRTSTYGQAMRKSVQYRDVKPAAHPCRQIFSQEKCPSTASEHPFPASLTSSDSLVPALPSAAGSGYDRISSQPESTLAFSLELHAATSPMAYLPPQIMILDTQYPSLPLFL